MSGRKKGKQPKSPSKNKQYAIISNEDEEEKNYNTNGLIKNQRSKPHIEMAQSIDSDDQEVKEDDDDASNYSMSTSSSDISDLSNEFVNATEYQISVTKQKQYAQTLEKIMEQDVEDPKFEHMMDGIINELINYAFGVDRQRTIEEAVEFLSTQYPEDAMTNIHDKLDNEIKGRLTDTFGQEYEIGAIEIMMQICTKILSMRKVVMEYPMIFVPLSFEKYQPRFMTKKSQRRHKLKRQMRKRQQSMDPKLAHKMNFQRMRSGSKHKRNKLSLDESINNRNINKILDENEDDESLSDLSDGGNNDHLRDENLNQRLKNIKQFGKEYGMKSKRSLNVDSDNENEEENKNEDMDPNDDTDEDKDEDDRVIERAKSDPSDAGSSHKIMKHKTMPQRSKTRSKVRLQKMRSGQTLVLIPIPGTTSTGSIFDRKGSYATGRGHFPDQSAVIKHRLSDVSTHQISIANGYSRAQSITPRMQDIEEENAEIDHLAAPPLQSLTSDASYNVHRVLQSTINATTKSLKPLNDSPHNKSPIKSRKLSNREEQQSQDMEYLRNWTTSFLFKPSKETKVLDPADLLKRNDVDVCEGCQTKIKLKHLENNSLPTYQAGEGSNKQTFVFCDKYCERLRKYKEAIRQYAFEYEFAQTYGVMPCEMDKPDRFIHLFAMKDGLLVVDSELSRNANTDDKKPCKPRPSKKDKGDKDSPNNQNNGYTKKSSADKSSSSMRGHIHSNSPSMNKLHGYKVTEDGLRRERRLALLTLWREAIKNVLPNLPNAQSIELEMSAQQTIQKLDESRELPELLRYMDVAIYGRPLWFFCVDQLSTKDRPPLWCILEFLATELPTAMSINLLERTRDALVRFQVEPLDNVCLKIIASSTYPIATALYLAAFMSQNGVRDSSRSDRFQTKSEKYIAIATHLLAQIESDHLLAILIEIPSNIDDLSILDIVIRFKLEGFLEFHRLQPIFMNMWTEYKYLDPSQPFRNKESDSIFVFELCRKTPSLFYYSPVGAFTLQCTMYIIHVLLVSILTTQLLYPYKDLETLEVVVWVFNAGFVLYEFMELAIRKIGGYFQYYSNWVGFITSIIWVFLAILRFGTHYQWRRDYYCNPNKIQCDEYPEWEPDPCPGDPDWNNDTSDHPCFRNAPLTEIYMIFWAIQVVLLWCRMAALLQRNRHAGPLLRMILNMMAEIASFAILLFLFMVGFVLAVLYIVGGDVHPSEELGGGLNRITSVFLYHIQALLAAQEWSVVVSNDEGFNSERSVMVEACMVFLSIFGTFILMNLFIALLTITYESAKQTNKLKTNFARITHTIELDRKSAIMPPPLNILVFLLTIIYQLFEVAIIFVTCGYWQTKLQILYPIKYSLYKQLKQKEKETKHRRRGSMVPFTGSSTIIGADGTGSPRNGRGTRSQTLVNGLPNTTKDLTRLNTELASQSFFRDVTIDALRDQHTMGALDYKTHCGCFVRSVEGHKSNPCKNLNKQWRLRHRESYCRHCRHSLTLKKKDVGDTKKTEPIDPYFNLFKHYQLLDEDDKKLIRLRLNKRNLCPHCYRVYKSDREDSDKRKKKYALSRFQVVLEVMSYYVFIFFIWWWLVIVLLVPAFITWFVRRLNHDYHEQTADFNQSIIHNVSQIDPEYRIKVEQVIKDYNDKEDGSPGITDNLIQREVTGNTLIQKKSETLTEKDPSPSPLKKYESLHPKHKTRTDLNPRLKQFQDSVEEEFNDLYIGGKRAGMDNKLPTIYSKPGSETSMDEKLNKMEQQMQEIRHLILTQNTLKMNSSNDLRQNSPDPLQLNNKRKKKVTFSSDLEDINNNALQRRKENTDFETLLSFMKGMKSELSNIKQKLNNPVNNNINDTELKEEEEDEEHGDDGNELLLTTPRDDTITPRVPSHARRNNRQINHLDIGNLLPSPSPVTKSIQSTAL